MSVGKCVGSTCNTLSSALENIEHGVLAQTHIEMNNPSPKESWSELTRIAPRWFAFLAALAYGTGYLCVSTFLNYFGIRESGGDFFRTKFIHVGILFLLFPFSILLPFVLAVSLRRSARRQAELAKVELEANRSSPVLMSAESNRDIPAKSEAEEPFRIHFSGILSFMNMCVIIYILMLFAPRSFILSKIHMFPIIIVVSLFGSHLIEYFVDSFIVPRRSEAFSRGLRWTFLIGIIGSLDFLTFDGFFPQLREIFWGETLTPKGAGYYMLLLALIPYVISRTNKQARKAPSERARFQVKLSGVCFSLMLYLAATVAFALHVYPKIPVAKGGGNYADSPAVTIRLHQDARTYLPDMEYEALKRDLSTPNRYIVIEETPASLFLARKDDAGGPQNWCWMRRLPSIVELRRETADQIRYTMATP